jgi:hypothetical protein
MKLMERGAERVNSASAAPGTEPFAAPRPFIPVKSADEYLRRAAEADETAAKACDPTVRLQWTDLADQWRTLALQSGYFADGRRELRSPLTDP